MEQEVHKRKEIKGKKKTNGKVRIKREIKGEKKVPWRRKLIKVRR